MSSGGAFSWNSELPSGRSPAWVRDEGLAGLGLHAGDAVSVDSRAEPSDGDLVVAEIEVNGDSQRITRRYRDLGEGRVRLEPVGAPLPPDIQPLALNLESVILMGVIRGRVRIQDGGARILEEPLTNASVDPAT